MNLLRQQYNYNLCCICCDTLWKHINQLVVCCSEWIWIWILTHTLFGEIHIDEFCPSLRFWRLDQWKSTCLVQSLYVGNNIMKCILQMLLCTWCYDIMYTIAFVVYVSPQRIMNYKLFYGFICRKWSADTRKIELTW